MKISIINVSAARWWGQPRFMISCLCFSHDILHGRLCLPGNTALDHIPHMGNVQETSKGLQDLAPAVETQR